MDTVNVIIIFLLIPGAFITSWIILWYNFEQFNNLLEKSRASEKIKAKEIKLYLSNVYL